VRGIIVGVALGALASLACVSLAGSAAEAADAGLAEKFRLLRLDGRQVKWGSPELGTGARVSYALVAGRVHFSGSHNCGEMAPVAPLLASSGISAADFTTELRAAFAMWEAVADISFEPAADPSKAQILIGIQGKPTGWAFANVAYDRSTDAATGRIEKSLICLNPTKLWKIGFGGDVRIYDLRYTFAHEIGHAIGLDHPGPAGQLMAFEYVETSRELQPGDIHGAVLLYGVRGMRSAAPSVPAADAPSAALALQSRQPSHAEWTRDASMER